MDIKFSGSLDAIVAEIKSFLKSVEAATPKVQIDRSVFDTELDHLLGSDPIDLELLGKPLDPVKDLLTDINETDKALENLFDTDIAVPPVATEKIELTVEVPPKKSRRRRRLNGDTETETAEAPVAKGDETGLTISDLTKAASAAAQVIKPAGVKKILATYGITDLSDLPENRWEGFINAVTAAAKRAKK